MNWLKAMLAGVLCIGSVNAANITKSAEENIIYVEGMIDFGDVDVMRVALVGMESPLIVLASQGGRVSVGGNLFILLSEHGVNTYVPDGYSCASICSYIWLAGTHRRIGQEASLGVHQMSATNDDELLKDPREYVINSMEIMGTLIGTARYHNAEVDPYYWAEWLTTRPEEINWLHRNLIERLER